MRPRVEHSAAADPATLPSERAGGTPPMRPCAGSGDFATMLADAPPPSPHTHTAPAADPAGAPTNECTAGARTPRARGSASTMLAFALASAAPPIPSATDS